MRPAPSSDSISLGPFAFARLNLPPFALNWRVDSGQNRPVVRCLNRQKWVALEPEEWVRQHWLHHLHQDLGYPLGLISVEHAVQLNGMSRFADIVCHDRSGAPVLILELKRPNVKLGPKTLDQVLRYHLVMQSPMVVISNGLQHQGFRFENGSFKPLDALPAF